MLDEFAGIFALDQQLKSNERDRVSGNKIRDLNDQIDSLRREQKEKEDLRKVNDEFKEQQTQRDKDYIQASKDINARNIKENMQLQGEIRRLEGELNFYKQLVATNPATVANYSPEFKKEYMRECDLLSEWMMSQKGFKDIANKFGEKLGLSEQEVRKMATTSGIDVMTKEANERKAKGEMQGDYDQYNVERVERVKEILTERFLK